MCFPMAVIRWHQFSALLNNSLVGEPSREIGRQPANNKNMKTEQKIHNGNLQAKAGVIYDFTEITGTLDASGADTKTAFPKLTTIGGYLDARGADTETAFPKLTTIGGYLDARDADTKTAFPELTTIGGTLYAHGADTKTAFPKLKSQGYESALQAALKLVGLCKVDGILAKVINKRGPVSRVVIVGQTQQSYIVEREGKFAHGKTLAEARADLLMKLGTRDTSQFKGWTTETKVALEQIIVAYRTITGACGQGCSHFLASKNYPPKVTVGFIIEETKGAYGHEAFRNFFNK